MFDLAQKAVKLGIAKELTADAEKFLIGPE